MNKQKLPRSSSLFLLELTFSILFFSIASGICIQVFVRARTLSRDAQALHQAVTLCSNASELADAAPDAASALASLAALYPEAVVTEAGSDSDTNTDSDADSYQLTLGFTSKLESCPLDTSDAAPAYLFRVSFYQVDNLLHCDAVMTKSGADDAAQEIYRLETVHYL